MKSINSLVTILRLKPMRALAIYMNLFLDSKHKTMNSIHQLMKQDLAIGELVRENFNYKHNPRLPPLFSSQSLSQSRITNEGIHSDKISLQKQPVDP